MAHFYTPTVIEPHIPLPSILPLERLFLAQIFEEERHGDRVYYYSGTGANDHIILPADEVRAALCDALPNSRLAQKLFEEQPDAARGDGNFELDDCGEIWPEILQDIVRRSAELDHLTVTMAFTCTKMRPDGFGGSAMLITAKAIRWESTTTIFERFYKEAGAAGEIDHDHS
jgi:hypothetical protein